MENKVRVFFLIIIFWSFIISWQFFEEKSEIKIFLDKSGPYIGTNFPNQNGFDGSEIKIAVIDTGVDYNHPDLFGFGPEGKVVGGYDFMENDFTPIDTNGHGTEVAGIIAADGKLKGIAPKSKILAYRVSDDGESVASDLIVKAIKQAVIDQADIINISLGVNKTNKKIDDAVNDAISNGIVVVTAAGNNGPGLGTIGSPGRNPNTITVGASYNNISSSLVSTLEVDDLQFQVIPMVGTNALDEPIISEIKFGKFGRERDLQNFNVQNSILLVERGSDVENEIVYFSDKEYNAAIAGAKAIIVYNNKPGMFLGELVHEFSGPNYKPTIPALSMSNEDGKKLKNLLQNKTIGKIHVFYNPDFVAHFSSRGPVSPFYIKPDMVAPGAFVNTTLTDGKYNFTSGTSFAAPHVAGAAALLLEKEPDLKPNEIKSLLVTTSDPVADAYGKRFPIEVGGTGRINVTKAFDAKMIIEPTFLVFNLSPEKPTQSDYLEFYGKHDSIEDFEISFIGNDAVDFEYQIENNRIVVSASLIDTLYGNHEDRIVIKEDLVTYSIPVLIHVTKGGINVNEIQGKLNFDILFPEEWSYAKISIINGETGKTDTTSATPVNDASLRVFEPGEYWIESKIRYNEQTFNAYEKFEVKTITQSMDLFNLLDIPERPIIIVFFVIVAIALVGLKIRK